MRKKTILVLLFAILAIVILVHSLASSARITSSNNKASSAGLEPIVLEKYSGWKGVESMITPLDEYERAITGNAPAYSEVLWPYADSPNPFRDLVNRGVGVVIVTIESIKDIYVYSGIFTYVVYEAKIDKVIVKPVNTIIIPPQVECTKSPELCELATNQSRIINELVSMIREGNTIELLVRAFIAKDSVNKTALTISDIASPFPLLEPGYQYLVFLRLELFGIIVNYDYVWGSWAYLVLDGKVYSLNYVKPPANVSLDPAELFKSPYIYWKPYPYEKLREIAIQKLSAYDEPLETFISKITEG